MTEAFVRSAVSLNPKFTRQSKQTRAIVNGEIRAFDRGYFHDPCETESAPKASAGATTGTATVAPQFVKNTAPQFVKNNAPSSVNVPRCKYNTKCVQPGVNMHLFTCIFDSLQSSVCYVVHGEFDKAFSKAHLFYFTALAILLFVIGFLF